MHHLGVGVLKMGVVALVMAGGKAMRMESSHEKPLIEICGKPMIERVIQALRRSKGIDEIIVATSKFTPKTTEAMLASSVKTVETSGDDYHADMRHAIEKCALFRPVMVISADLPLITKKLIDGVIAYYKRCGKPALTVAVKARVYEKLGLELKNQIRVKGELYVPAGINIIDGKYINRPSIPEEILVLDEADFVVNVNTRTDLEIVEKLLAGK